MIALVALSFWSGCKKDEADFSSDGWQRDGSGPVYRDEVTGVDYDYEIASDPHVFYAEDSTLHMIYTGDVNEKVAIKLASGASWTGWTKARTLLSTPNSAGTDAYKETSFYRRSATGKHQIYYIGYADEESYQSQIFLAEADSLTGQFVQNVQPVVPRGTIAGKSVYCMTSPSIVEHDSLLYMVFIGWDNSPTKVKEVWLLGATSTDDGHTWSNFQNVTTPIGMEGQLTKTPDGDFVAVRTGEYKRGEAIYYARAAHPFGPWVQNEAPILIQMGAPYEKDEITAAQITYDIQTGKQYLFYTGAHHRKGYWIMLATKE